MKEHRLKTWYSEWLALKDGRKRFEIRKNDRDFSVGDVLRLEAWDPGRNQGVTADGVLTDPSGPSTSMIMPDHSYKPGAMLTARVSHIVQGRFGLPADVCVMSLEVYCDEKL